MGQIARERAESGRRGQLRRNFGVAADGGAGEAARPKRLCADRYAAGDRQRCQAGDSSPPDLWAAEGTIKLAAEEKRRIVLVFNRAPAASKLRKRLEAEIAARGLHLLDAALANRAGYANAFADGLGVTEAGPGTAAADELRALAAAVLAQVQG
jgi:hypothetical protein